MKGETTFGFKSFLVASPRYSRRQNPAPSPPNNVGRIWRFDICRPHCRRMAIAVAIAEDGWAPRGRNFVAGTFRRQNEAAETSQNLSTLFGGGGFEFCRRLHSAGANLHALVDLFIRIHENTVLAAFLTWFYAPARIKDGVDPNQNYSYLWVFFRPVWPTGRKTRGRNSCFATPNRRLRSLSDNVS